MTAPISIAEKPTLNTFTNEYKISSNNNQYLIKISYSDKITITINFIILLYCRFNSFITHKIK